MNAEYDAITAAQLIESAHAPGQEERDALLEMAERAGMYWMDRSDRAERQVRQWRGIALALGFVLGVVIVVGVWG